MDIPTTNSSIQLDLLHPRFVTRLEAFFAVSAAKTPLPLLVGGNSIVKVMAAEIGPVHVADEADLGIDHLPRQKIAQTHFPAGADQ